MNREEMARLVRECSDEIFAKNQEILNGDGVLTGNVEIAAEIGSIITMNVLAKLGLIKLED
ncbi:hypothetical protein ACFSR7_36085 [Cohnella sp. GCM10020058]|uniref:hypothetical protein n=1 Tax=Cohnella sp. GCM10020058 TaxID=3317330 RepID=UPI00362AB2BB